MNRRFNKFTFFTGRGKLNLRQATKDVEKTIKNLQQIIVDLQTHNNISIILCDHQARDLLSCVDLALVLSNGRVIAKDTPNNLIRNIDAQNAYFGDSFKIN